MLRFGALRRGAEDRGNLQRQDVTRERINQAILDGTSPIGQPYERMLEWQQKFLDGDYTSVTVTKRLSDSCFGEYMIERKY